MSTVPSKVFAVILPFDSVTDEDVHDNGDSCSVTYSEGEAPHRPLSKLAEHSAGR